MIARVAPRILALDPGNERTGVVLYCDKVVIASEIVVNGDLLNILRQKDGILVDAGRDIVTLSGIDTLAIEMIASYGMAVGKEVFDTCVWIGRFIEAWGAEHRLVYRREVKLHLCESARANDSNVRAALIDRWGGKDKAVGLKRTPGPLYGVKSHCWPALAVAVTVADQMASHAALRTSGAGRGA